MSKFVSGGTIDEPVERDDDWLKAQQEIEATRRRKEEEGRQDGGKSLYDTLQANKGLHSRCRFFRVAAKQEAFEESIRLKNQFRSLDEDEVEFLDSVLESTRAKESAIRQETVEQLEAFRKQQEQVEKASLTEDSKDIDQVVEEQWIASGRKRKKGVEKPVLKGVKRRKSSSAAADHSHDPISGVEDKHGLAQVAGNRVHNNQTSTIEKPVDTAAAIDPPRTATESWVKTSSTTKALPAMNLGLGLTEYASDDDD